jgi:hypothetical protein
VKALQDGERMREYLALLRTMDGYASIVFPHCASDAKREGHVIPIVSFQAFRLQVGFLLGMEQNKKSLKIDVLF